MNTTQVNLQYINEQAKFYFDNKQFNKALELLENRDLPTELLGNLAKCYYYTRQADKALDIMLNLPNKDQNAWIDTALYYNALGRSEDSYHIYRQLDQSDPKVRFNIAYHLLEKNQFREGFQYIQSGSSLRAWGSEYLLIEQNKVDSKRRWNGQRTNHLALILEGGLGDEIIFLRWAKHLQTLCNQLTVFCHPSLLRLLVNSGYNAQPYTMVEHVDYDHYAPAMSLPAICNFNSPQQHVQFPYIESFVEPYITKQIDSIAQGRKKIGIKWFGNPQFEHDQFRTIPKDAVKSLSLYGQLFSMQFEDEDESIPNCKEIIRDWQDTYSVFKSLDLLVTSCTSTAHLAGTIGLKTIVFAPLVPYFVWTSGDMKWYPSNVDIIRQTKYNDWNEPIEKLYKIMETL
jgi:tetratricopeptide (TPR) repeat protein